MLKPAMPGAALPSQGMLQMHAVHPCAKCKRHIVGGECPFCFAQSLSPAAQEIQQADAARLAGYEVMLRKVAGFLRDMECVLGVPIPLAVEIEEVLK
jgi:hypothetical protein